MFEREFIVTFSDKLAIEKFLRVHGTEGELVRCKDCEWKQGHYCHCKNGIVEYGTFVQDNDYCNYGGKK